jgi:hypothetical protein
MTNVSTPIEPLAGVNFGEILTSADARYTQIPLGTVIRARNGRMYCFVEQSAVSIADNTPVIVTEGGPPPAFTTAAGAGAWTNRSGITPAAVARLWVESNAI